MTHWFLGVKGQKVSRKLYDFIGKTAVVTGKCVLKFLSKRPLLCLSRIPLRALKKYTTDIQTQTHTQAFQRDTVVVMTARHSSVVCFSSVSSPRSSEELIRQ